MGEQYTCFVLTLDHCICIVKYRQSLSGRRKCFSLASQRKYKQTNASIVKASLWYNRFCSMKSLAPLKHRLILLFLRDLFRLCIFRRSHMTYDQREVFYDIVYNRSNTAIWYGKVKDIVRLTDINYSSGPCLSCPKLSIILFIIRPLTVSNMDQAMYILFNFVCLYFSILFRYTFTNCAKKDPLSIIVTWSANYKDQRMYCLLHSQ